MSVNVTDADRAIRRWPTTKSRRWIVDLLERALHDTNILAIIAVGSAVRPKVEAEDVDLVIIAEDRDPLQVRAPIEVDVGLFELRDVEERLSESHPLLGWAVKYGIALLDRDDTWASIVDAWSDHPLLPDPEKAREQAARTAEYVAQLRQVGDAVAVNEIELARLTLMARAALSEAGVFPASRPELPAQLREIGESELASELERVIARRAADRRLSIRAV